MNALRKALILVIAGTSCNFLLVGCGGGAGAAGPAPIVSTPPPPSPPPSLPPPPIPPAAHTVRGEVFSFDTGMVPNADVNLWVQTPGFGYSYWYANGPLRSDALGQFEAQVPTSEITVLAVADGFVQPCGVRGDVTDDLEVRVELLPISVFNSAVGTLPQLAREPAVTGLVFETTADGPVPVVGAGVWAEHGFEIGMATTRTNQVGWFYLCNLAEDTWLAFYKEGFVTRWVGPFDAANHPWGFEIELVRERR